MKSTGLLLFLAALSAGCATKGPLQGTSTQREGLSPLTVSPVRLPSLPAPPTAPPTPKIPTPSADDLAYLRWLMQFDAAVRQILAEQEHALPAALEQQQRTRVRAMVGKWEFSPEEVGVLTTKASMATEFALRLQRLLLLFQSHPAPVDCRDIAAGYSQVLGSLSESSAFNVRLYREYAKLMRNPRGASQMISGDLQDGGIAADTEIARHRQSATGSTNAALADFLGRYPGQVPADIAAFWVQ